MSLIVFNTLTREKEPFEPLEPGVVRMYNCGPTVYARQHLGNWRSFLFADTLRRWLDHLGYTVHQVMNITDVGHLTDDEREEGEDKIQAQARREALDPWQISQRYIDLFQADLEDLGIRRAERYPRATEHVDEMLEMIEGLLEKGYAYQIGGDVYFDVSCFERYGRLSGNRVADLEAGARIAVREEKRRPEDFALWKSDPAHLMKWPTRFGPHGFPGWHIECSAMARKHLGDRIDIHTGGEDNIFPHHECEIAQSESFTGVPFARYWMHARFLLVDGGKMAKRLGNVYTLDDVRERGFRLEALRYALVRGHYREPLNFTWEVLEQCTAALEGLEDLVRRLRRACEGQGAAPEAGAGLDLVDAARAKLAAGMNDDLNTPVALAALHELRDHAVQGRLSAEAARAGIAFLEEAERVFGFPSVAEEALPAALQRRVEEREKARAAKDWGEADRLRDELLAEGVVLEDTPEGVVWRRR